MGEIYAGSVCTIAALTARHAYDGGCFSVLGRNPLSYRRCQVSPYWTVKENSYIAPDLRLRPPWSPMEFFFFFFFWDPRFLPLRAEPYGRQ